MFNFSQIETAGEGEEKVDGDGEEEPAEVLPPACIDLQEFKLKVVEDYEAVFFAPPLHRLIISKGFTRCPMRLKRWTELQTFVRWSPHFFAFLNMHILYSAF